MRVLVTGASGLLGSDLVAAAEKAGHEVRGCARLQLDVTDLEAVRDRIGLDRPDVVINCAAMTDLERAEAEPDLAMAVNATGAGNVARAAAEAGARVLYVSTDQVFDGGKDSPYVESDVPQPLSAYGRSKLAGEEATLFSNERSTVVRTSSLFGIGGDSFVDTMLQLGRRDGRVLAVHDRVSSPTWTWHLSHGLIRMFEADLRGIHHLAGGGSCSRYDLARDLFELAGVEVAVLSADSRMLGTSVPVPAFSALESEEPTPITLPPWIEGLDGYLTQLAEAAV